MTMNRAKLTILLPLITSFLFFFNGCMPRQADGSYHSSYSYHPYNKKAPKKIYTKQIHRPVTKKLYRPKKVNVTQKKFSYTKPIKKYKRVYRKKPREIVKRVKVETNDNPPSNVKRDTITETLFSSKKPSQSKIIYVYPNDKKPKPYSEE